MKGFTAAWYRRLGGDLSCVQRFIQAAAASAHVELTTLVVPGENDSPQEMDELARWVASIDQIYRCTSTAFPRRHARGCPYPISTLHALADIARQHLTRVQVGNVKVNNNSKQNVRRQIPATFC